MIGHLVAIPRSALGRLLPVAPRQPKRPVSTDFQPFKIEFTISRIVRLLLRQHQTSVCIEFGAARSRKTATSGHSSYRNSRRIHNLINIGLYFFFFSPFQHQIYSEGSQSGQNVFQRMATKFFVAERKYFRIVCLSEFCQQIKGEGKN